ncbi:MAG: hypothetical protein Kow00109_01490 [Acidobacteriota bacterium]
MKSLLPEWLGEWNWERWSVEQSLVALAALGVLVAIVFLVLWWRGRRRRVLEGLKLSDFRGTHPCFYDVMVWLGRHGRAEAFLRREEVRSAWRDLQRWQSRAARAKKGGALSGVLEGNERLRAEAAVVRILRAVVMDEELARELPRETLGEIDLYLDRLTA